MPDSYDGYLVMRQYQSCDASVLALFEDESVSWYFNDLGCADCYTSLGEGYYKSDTPNRKKTFTIGYSYTKSDDDTNKAGQVDKYQLTILGLQALGATEQQIYDCVAGAKPQALIASRNEGCDYSDCVGEEVLIW